MFRWTVKCHAFVYMMVITATSFEWNFCKRLEKSMQSSIQLFYFSNTELCLCALFGLKFCFHKKLSISARFVYKTGMRSCKYESQLRQISKQIAKQTTKSTRNQCYHNGRNFVKCPKFHSDCRWSFRDHRAPILF